MREPERVQFLRRFAADIVRYKTGEADRFSSLKIHCRAVFAQFGCQLPCSLASLAIDWALVEYTYAELSSSRWRALP